VVSCLVHARKRPYGPLTRRYAPTAATALPGPLRPRTEASETFLAGIALQGRGWVRQNLSKQQPAAPGNGATHYQSCTQLLLAPPCRKAAFRELARQSRLCIQFRVNGSESFLLPVKIHSGSRKIRENVRSESEGKIGPSGVVRAGCAGIR